MSEATELTRAQLLFWTGQKLEPTAALYNMAVIIAIEGDLDPDRFEQALRKVIGNCDALMTVFEESADLPRMRVDRNLQWTLERVDFSNDPNPQAAVRQWADDRCRRVFDLGQLLFDAVLLKVGNGRYVWYFNQHHLVTDAWSTSVLFKHVSQAYAYAGYQPNIPSFRDFITFERAARQSPGYAQIADHWQNKTAELSAPPQQYGLRATSTSTSSERIRIPIGRERSERLRALAIEDDVRCLTLHLTLFNVFSTLLFAYLYRISGQSDLAIGAPAHNRPTLQFRETIGVFIELFPLTANIGPTDTFQSVLEKLKVETGEFLRYAKPGASQPEYNRGFNTILNYINAAFGGFAEMPTQTDWLHTGHSDRGHHLRLVVYDFDASGDFVLEFDANTEIFGEGLRSRMAGHFLNLVDAFLGDRSGAIDAVALLGEDELQQLRDFGTGESLAQDSSKTLANAVLQHASASPERIAVTTGDGQLTYAELERASRRIAERLEHHDIERGSVVPVVASASCAWIAAIIGVLRHGSAYVPVDPLTPSERFRRVMQDTEAKAILAADSSILPCEVDAVCIDIRDLVRSEGELTLSVTYDHSTPDSVAYVLYTSGSTGEPKGVCVPHGAVLNLIRYNEQCVPIGAGADCAIWTNVGFDVSVYELFTALASGHTLHVPDEKARIDSEQLFRFWKDNAIVSGYLPPFLLPSLDHWLESNQWNAKRILVGVEPIPHALLVSIAKKSPGLKIINGYGPTEATVCASFFVVDADSDPTNGRTPIGRPLANTTCRILDAQQNQVALGAVGELWVSGAGLASGYLNDSSLTSERFGELQINGESVRAYRTGDAVRYREDGQLEFVGRLDQQLKIRGIRIEAAEIQAAVLSHPAIDECAIKAIASGADGGSTELAAYFVASSPIESAALRRKLRGRLPEGVIPAFLLQVESLPRTSSGKINFTALPDPPSSQSDNATALPEGPVEENICGIFAELLGKNEIGVDRSFIQLGGDSLFAMRALVRIDQEFDLDLPLHTLFEAPSVREISEVVTAILMAEIEALDDAEAERLAAET